MPLDYCQCCKINHESGRGHIYSKKHIIKLGEWADRQKKRVADVILLAQNGYANTMISKHSFWCAFCGKEIIGEEPMIFENHRNKVYSFFRENGTNNKTIDHRWFYVGNPFKTDYYNNCQMWIQHHKIIPSMFSDKTVIVGCSPASSLDKKEDVLPKKEKPKKHSNTPTTIDDQLKKYSYDLLLNGPLQCDAYIVRHDTDGHEIFPTCISEDGVIQNVSGLSAVGRRVWGGGIVKCTAAEWVPWPADLLMLHYYRRRSEEQRLDEEKEAALVKETLEKEAQDEVASDRIHTTQAVGSGLTCIELSTGTDGNIRNLALPPWIGGQDDDRVMREWKKQKEHEERFRRKLRASDVGVVRGRQAKADWLPNFGGVWSSGPRRETRTNFIDEMQAMQERAMATVCMTVKDRVTVGEQSSIKSLQDMVDVGGRGMTEEAKEKIVQQGLKSVKEKIQRRMLSR